MIILRSQFIEKADEYQAPLIIIHKDDVSLIIERLNAGDGAVLRLSVDDIQPWEYKYFYWSFTKGGFLEADDFANSRDGDAFMRSHRGCQEGAVLTVARGETDEIFVVVSQPMHTDLPFNVHDKFGSSTSILGEIIPGFLDGPFMRSVIAKNDLIARVNPMSMLAEQEKQIDLLSMLVISLAEKQPEDERPDWLPQFKAMLEQSSSLQFKGPDKAIEGIADRKAHIRSLQEQYYKTKSGGA